jgi:hypothetical protein
MDNGKLKMESGKWKVESEGRMIENGKNNEDYLRESIVFYVARMPLRPDCLCAGG